MLCKYLTEDVWNKYKDSKDAQGVTFKQCIMSGCQNTDSGIGVYAASPDSYQSFKDLFIPIVEDYHKY
jgi:arginine kinase